MLSGTFGPAGKRRSETLPLVRAAVEVARLAGARVRAAGRAWSTTTAEGERPLLDSYPD